MADITANCTFKYAVAGDLKIVSIVTPAAAASGDTIDLGSDTAHLRGTKVSLILNTLLQDDAGADKTCTWVPSTGVITLGTITTGIHNLVVIGQ